MGAVPHRRRLLRRGLRRRPPISQLNRSAAAVEPNSSSESPPPPHWNGPGRRPAPTLSERTMSVSRCCCRACLPSVAHSSNAMAQTIAARCPSVPCARAIIGPARLRNSMPWPTPTRGLMKSRPSTFACSRPALLQTRTSRALTKCFGNGWTARASKARLWWAASRLLGRRIGSAGSCTPKCSPSASTRNAWQQLEAALRDSGTADPVMPKPLRNPDKQLSYCIKFVTYHQPGRRRVRLPPDRLVELAAWCSRHRFEDFLFAYGARRRGGRTRRRQVVAPGSFAPARLNGGDGVGPRRGAFERCNPNKSTNDAMK